MARLISGDRTVKFQQTLSRLLHKTGLRQKTIKLMTESPEYLQIYNCAFTHKSYDPIHNYEYYEIIGDAIVNTCIVLYLKSRFPCLSTDPDYVGILARLKNELQSQKSFNHIMENLELWEYVSAEYTIKNSDKYKISDDVFEAFFGATYTICENIYATHKTGSAFHVIYKIISKIFDHVSISLKYEDLCDAKSRLKELFDSRKDLGKLRYKKRTTQHKLFIVTCMASGTILSSAEASTLNEAQQLAAERALHGLSLQGIRKNIPPAYLKLYQAIPQ